LRAVPFLNYVPSQTSSAALALAYFTLGFSIWNKKMKDTFGYDIDELKELIVHLNGIHHEAPELPQQAIQDKYKASKYLQVSTLAPKKIAIEDLNEMISQLDGSDELNTTAENIENVRQKTEMLFN
jgi:cyclin-A